MWDIHAATLPQARACAAALTLFYAERASND